MRRLAAVVLTVAVMAVAGFGIFRLEQDLSEAGPGGDVLDKPVCNYDPNTGIPLPGSDPMCPRIAPCAGCTPIPVTPPTTYTGLIRPDPGAALSQPPVHRAGDAPSLGRGDCPRDWEALVSDTTGMSVCFPADLGRASVGETGADVADEDRFQITLSVEDLRAVATVDFLRSAGTTFPHDLDCRSPSASLIQGAPAQECLWAEGRHQVYEQVESFYNRALLVQKSGRQWVFQAVIWGSAGKDPGNFGALTDAISEMLMYWRLP